MVMPNIGAFIAWGFVTALFIPSGWWPNAQMARLVDPMLTYLLPLLIAYTAGRNVAGERGGVIGAIAAMGVVGRITAFANSAATSRCSSEPWSWARWAGIRSGGSTNLRRDA